MEEAKKKGLLPESGKIICDLLILQSELMQAIEDGNSYRKVINDFFVRNSGEKADVAKISEFHINNATDGALIPLRLYEVDEKTEKVIVFAHGGGWIQGNFETHDYLCRKLANSLKINVLAVEYRLSPEHKFPIPLDDVLNAYLWAANKYSRVILSGDSAGGNLCAATCLKLHDMNIPYKPHSLLLFYPALGGDFQTDSYLKFGNLASLSLLGSLYYYSQYIGECQFANSKITDKYIAPILAEDMNCFPRTMIVSASCDALFSHQLMFKDRMLAAHNDCQQIILDGAVHGFMTYGKLFDDYNSEILQRVANWMTERV